MEGRDAEARNQNGEQEQRVARSNRGKGHPGTSQENAAGHEPHRTVRIRPVSEERLHDRRAERCDQNDGAGQGVGEIELRNDEDEERGHGALREIDRSMAEREAHHPPAIDAGTHPRRITTAISRTGPAAGCTRGVHATRERRGLASGSLRRLRAGVVAGDQRVRELPLGTNDRLAIALERGRIGSARAQAFPLAQQLLQYLLEGLDRRVSLLASSRSPLHRLRGHVTQVRSRLSTVAVSSDSMRRSPMEITTVETPVEEVETDVLAFPVTATAELLGIGAKLDETLGGRLSHLIADGELTGKLGL